MSALPPFPPVLVIGASGVVGRPLVRALTAAGNRVRVLARDPRRTAATVSDEVEVVPGDLRDVTSIRRGLAGCRAVITAAANPLRRSRPAFDPDADGTANLIAAARGMPAAPLIVRTSAMAIDRAADRWWVAAAKRDADETLLASGLPAVVLRPTWFVETLATTAVGPFLFRLPAPSDRIWWLAGEDYGRLVAAILEDPAPATGRSLDVQGHDGCSVADAVARFIEPWRRHLRTVPIPGGMLRLAARLAEPPAFLAALLDYTFRHVVKVPRETAADSIHAPSLGIRPVAEALFRRGELPVKRLA